MSTRNSTRKSSYIEFSLLAKLLQSDCNAWSLIALTLQRECPCIGWPCIKRTLKAVLCWKLIAAGMVGHVLRTFDCSSLQSSSQINEGRCRQCLIHTRIMYLFLIVKSTVDFATVCTISCKYIKAVLCTLHHL